MWSLKLSRQCCSTFSMVGVRLRDWPWRYHVGHIFNVSYPWSVIFGWVWLKFLDHPKWIPFITILAYLVGAQIFQPRWRSSFSWGLGQGLWIHQLCRIASTKSTKKTSYFPTIQQEFRWSRNNPTRIQLCKDSPQITKHQQKLKQTSTKISTTILSKSFQTSMKYPVKLPSQNSHQFQARRLLQQGAGALAAQRLLSAQVGSNPKMVR